ncbi:MAG: phenylalanine--tRNA ligase subunit beta [Gammaproteobacteria bacterium]|nr:phenylalanine--tRNA ligase subunit beta [Gammaproteobacteria bacterium]
MKISERWLREWVNPPVTATELVAQLSMAGLEVDSAEPAAPPFTDVVVGSVVAVDPHPDADKLRVCQVDDGAGIHTVVCGAPNVEVGMLVPYARPGAVLPDGTRIGQAKLRGVASAGMLCGADELGLDAVRDGLMVLPANLTPGADLRDALELDDTLIEIDLTPNRGDCLGLRGLAREVGVLNDCAVKEPEISPVPARIDATFPVAVSHAQGCPRYLGRVIRGVDVTRSTPTWMTERLRRCGLRPIDPVVDVTNYVLLELGQPMHAFDLARLAGGIDVRLAKPEEELTLLDGSELTLRDDTLLITDANGPVAMAGIMGGENSGITTDPAGPTRDIFLECAFFSPLAISGRARSYGLHTDASHRYERGVDFGLQHLAMERATALLLDIVGGEPGPVTEALDQESLPARSGVTLREARLAQLLGMRIPTATVETMLVRLGLPPVATEDTDAGRVWQVQAPSWRFDIEREADLIEEVARIYGYDNIEVTLPASRMRLEPTLARRADADLFRTQLAASGHQEILSYSFVEPRLNDLFEPGIQAAPLANPISADLGAMRTSLWPGLVKTWIGNRNRQQPRARLFEIGRTFARDEGGAVAERSWVGGLLAGSRDPESWNQPALEVDFYDARGVVESLLALTRNREAWSFRVERHPGLHPGQSAAVYRSGGDGEVLAGWVGRMHPEVQAELDLPRPVYLFALALDVLEARDVPVHQGLSRFPSMRRDIAIEVDASVAGAAVLDCARKAAGEHLVDLSLFDVYAGDKLGPDRRSLALGVTLQHPDRTLEDGEVTARIDAIVQSLEAQLGAIRR